MTISASPLSIGLDVQIRRPCALAILDSQRRIVDTGWLEGDSAEAVCDGLCDRLATFDNSRSKRIPVGIDAPRQPLPASRRFYWDRRKADWRLRRSSDRGWGRHCEVVVRSCGLANPQWTPPEPESPDWMKLGYGLFRELDRRGFETLEVFPSAAYRQLKNERHSPVALDFSNFDGGPKDMLDACMAAFSVHEFMGKRGAAVGGGDGLGEIVLPRPLSEATPAKLLSWPETD